ncbi:MAG: hypothetical protein QF366_02615 [Candidatus Poseidoniia archaeon]|jgi:KaiC/GvpD/RAD55 family RecA-like ATPase|nr:hypothetical protein [Candidatus Poseidoniia archaeon]MDP6658158.1 hypothetical protein [Candidatus Poseidoniia archaeon]MDP6846515.1 hypothetical protein [Candidatus Poseidoniia archaeon]MDP7007320.1 hypothetical protein [Candidatus Poseidoniia archaeon]|tara:strand:+ start:3305 stop:3862 length:558 start_codon:yes stop_codon:yes gene_type:complete
MSVLKQVVKSIKEGDALTTVSLNSDDYRPTSIEIVKHLLSKKLGGIYITTTRPSGSIIADLEGIKADLGDLYFVDMISLTVGGETDDPRTMFIESPTMLESVLLNIGLLERRIKAKRHFVMFDSVNGLTIYSENRVLKEFINVLANTMRLRKTYTMMLTVEEQTSEDLASMLKTLTDRYIEKTDG